MAKTYKATTDRNARRTDTFTIMAGNLNTLSLRITTQGGIKNECLNNATSNSDLIGRERETKTEWVRMSGFQ